MRNKPVRSSFASRMDRKNDAQSLDVLRKKHVVRWGDLVVFIRGDLRLVWRVTPSDGKPRYKTVRPFCKTWNLAVAHARREIKQRQFLAEQRLMRQLLGDEA